MKGSTREQGNGYKGKRTSPDHIPPVRNSTDLSSQSWTLVGLDPPAPEVRVHLPVQSSWVGPLSTLDPVPDVVLVAGSGHLHGCPRRQGCTCLLPAWASRHLGLEGACNSEPAAIGPGALRRASARDRVTGQPTGSSKGETQRQGSLPYSLLCAHISVPRVGGQHLLWDLGGDVTLLGRDTATALSWASQLGHSSSCNDALSRTRAAELH